MQKKTEAQAKTKKITDSKAFWAVLSLVLSVFIWIYYSANYATEMTTTFYGVEVVYTGRDAMRDSLNLIVSHEFFLTLFQNYPVVCLYCSSTSCAVFLFLHLCLELI